MARSVHVVLLALAVAWAGVGRLAAQPPGQLTLEPFDFVAFDGTRLEAERGTFTVLENRQQADSAVISLALVRLPSTSTDPGPPIFFLAGGPGSSGIDTIGGGGVFRLARELLELGDVIAIDQRGTGASTPNLGCPARDDLSIPADEPFDAETVLEQIVASSKHCARTRRRRGIDLDGYNTEQSADDLDELRRALNADHMVLWGESYGTHLGMATIRRHGANVEKAILHGAEGPDHTLKLPRTADKTIKALAKQIRADDVYGPLLPDAVGTLAGLIAALDAEPRTVDGVTFGGQDLALLVALEIGGDRFFRTLPRLLVAGEEGDYTPLAQLLAALRQPIPLSAMSFAMDCASGASAKRARKAVRQARRSILGALLNYPLPEACEGWGVADLGDDFRSTLESDVPILFVSGTLDGRTPVANARKLRRGLPNSELLILEGVSHDGLLTADPRVATVLRDFLSGRPLTTRRVSFLPIAFDPMN